MLPQPLKQSLSFLVKISQAPSSIPVVFEYGTITPVGMQQTPGAAQLLYF